MAGGVRKPFKHGWKSKMPREQVMELRRAKGFFVRQQARRVIAGILDGTAGLAGAAIGTFLAPGAGSAAGFAIGQTIGSSLSGALRAKANNASLGQLAQMAGDQASNVATDLAVSAASNALGRPAKIPRLR